MCAVAAALPDLYLGHASETGLRSRPSDALFPPNELELDMQGYIELHAASKATIDVAEVKSSADYAAAVPQLGIRLNVLAWAVEACYSIPRSEMTLNGRLFVPRRAAAGLDLDQRDLAKRAWGYSLRLYRY